MPVPKVYELLGIEATNNLTIVKRAYRRKALELHPDKHVGADDLAVYVEKFKQLSNAYELVDEQDKLDRYYKAHLAGNLESLFAHSAAMAAQTGPSSRLMTVFVPVDCLIWLNQQRGSLTEAVAVEKFAQTLDFAEVLSALNRKISQNTFVGLTLEEAGQIATLHKCQVAQMIVRISIDVFDLIEQRTNEATLYPDMLNTKIGDFFTLKPGTSCTLESIQDVQLFVGNGPGFSILNTYVPRNAGYIQDLPGAVLAPVHSGVPLLEPASAAIAAQSSTFSSAHINIYLDVAPRIAARIISTRLSSSASSAAAQPAISAPASTQQRTGLLSYLPAFLFGSSASAAAPKQVIAPLAIEPPQAIAADTTEQYIPPALTILKKEIEKLTLEIEVSEEGDTKTMKENHLKRLQEAFLRQIERYADEARQKPTQPRSMKP